VPGEVEQAPAFVEEGAEFSAEGEHPVEEVEDSYMEAGAFDLEEHNVDIDMRYSGVEGRSERCVSVVAESEPVLWHSGP
jgi:hypothetical protein